MSTRAMIAIYSSQGKKLWEFDEIFYKHSDGYPWGYGVLRFLVPFLGAWVKKVGKDAYFLTANLVYLMQKSSWDQGLKKWKMWKKENKEQGTFFESDTFRNSVTEVGVSRTDTFHNDFKYLYRINMDEEKVMVYKAKESFVDYDNIEEIENFIELLYVIPFNAKSPKDGFTEQGLATYMIGR